MSRLQLVLCKICSALIALTVLSGLYLATFSIKDTRMSADKFVEILFQNHKNSQISRSLASKSLHMVKDRTLANKLVKEVRITCWIAVTDLTLDRVAMINETWGKRCTKILFIGDESTKGRDGIISLDIPNGRNKLWLKTQEAFKHIAKNHLEETDWILKADTDTYVIMENLRFLLNLQDPSRPHYLGCHVKSFIPKGYNSGGAGYIINKSALKKLLTEGFSNEKCNSGFREDEDINTGYCLSLIGILPEDTTDEHEKNRFFPFEPYDHVSQAKVGNRLWYWKTGHKPGKKSLDCCSETVISFHYIPANVFWTMEYLLYHTQLFGVTHSLQ